MDWTNSKVLVAGGAGLIGSHMARTLLDRGARVRVADDLSSGSLNNIKDIKNKIDFHQIDLREKKNCLKMTKGIDYVFQFAANMGGIGYITSIGADIMRDNILINTNMLQSAYENKVGKYFYSSSACVYPEYLQKDAKVTPLKEDDAYPADPDQFYGWEKIFTEKLCEAYRTDYAMNIKIARFHNIYGEVYTAFDKQKGKAPCHLIMKALRYPDQDYVVWGDGKQTRSFLYIDDCVEAVLRLMDSDYTGSINIGSDRMVTIDELAEMTIKISGKKIEIKHDLSKPQGVRGRNADLTLVKKVLNWEPSVSLEEGLKRTYAWAQERFAELENI
ncbi:MAG: NAD-dependent epimerase/dehydratase family protein [Dehalococcoidia bacterium]|nr:NAD-dependent epimerase/dehydratase family protein [Dehalococcoidia bacterium]